MEASFKGASEVMVKITGDGCTAGGAAAHGPTSPPRKLALETVHRGEVLQGPGLRRR